MLTNVDIPRAIEGEYDDETQEAISVPSEVAPEVAQIS